MLDVSSNVGASYFTAATSFVQTFTNNFNVAPYNTRVSIITFSDTPKLNFIFREYSGYSKTGLSNALKYLRYRGKLFFQEIHEHQSLYKF